MGLSKGKVAVGIIVIMVLIMVISKIFSGGEPRETEPTATPGPGITSTPTPTETATTPPVQSTPPAETIETPEPDANAIKDTLSTEGKGFEEFEALPVKEIMKVAETATFGTQEYMTLTKGETPEARAKRMKEYLYTKSKLFTDDMMGTGLVVTSHAVINNVIVAGANAEKAVYLISMDVSTQFIRSESDPLPVITTNRVEYNTLIQKTDEGWKITDIVESE